MTTSHFAKSRQVQRQLLTLLASTTILTAGCSNMTSTASSSLGATAQAIQLSGHIKGGNQPVSGATVTLYFAGQTGVPSAATPVATTTSANDGYGSFSFTRAADGGTNSGSGSTFSCPVNPPGSVLAQNGGPYVYVVARGGNTVNDGSSSVNNDAVFIAPFGRCGSIGASTFINMSEVVTVATVAAIHQYMDPTAANIETSIGADGIYISDVALSNSFNTVSNLVDLSTGLARTSTTRTSTTTGVAAVSVTITPELAKINHLADILSSCINNATSGSAACTTLYTNAVPVTDLSVTSVPGATAGPATDVLKAAYYISSNPTNGSTTNLQALYNIPAASGSPYMPRLTTQPSDWTIAIDYTSANTCSDVTGSTAGFLNSARDLGIDLNGNVYFANGQTGSGSLGALSAIGSPLSCFTLPTGTANNASNPGAVSTVVDTQGNVWVGSFRSSDVYRYTPGTGATITAATTGPVTALTADGYGDIFYATSGGIYEIANGATATTIPTGLLPVNTAPVGTVNHMMVDTNNTIWASSGSTFITGTVGTAISGPILPPTIAPPFTTTSYAAPGSTLGISATRFYGQAGVNGPGVYLSSTSNLSFLLSTGSIGTPFTGGGLNAPQAIAVDGAQNVWVANGSNGGLTEFSKGGTALSPSPAGFSKNFDNGNISGQQSIIIDASGNVWSGQIQSANTLQELVGAAVPTYQPYALGLPNQPGTRFQTIP